MHYSQDIDTIIKDELSNLIEISRRKEWPFVHDDIKKYYSVYENLIHNENKVENY